MMLLTSYCVVLVPLLDRLPSHVQGFKCHWSSHRLLLQLACLPGWPATQGVIYNWLLFFVSTRHSFTLSCHQFHKKNLFMFKNFKSKGFIWTFSSCELFFLQVNYTELGQICNLWRNYDDIEDSWDSVLGIIDWFFDNQDALVPAAGPGKWNDPDMVCLADIWTDQIFTFTHLFTEGLPERLSSRWVEDRKNT